MVFTARVQRGPSQAARCASTGTIRLPLLHSLLEASPFRLIQERLTIQQARATPQYPVSLAIQNHQEKPYVPAG